jgi:hypothetical protein
VASTCGAGPIGVACRGMHAVLSIPSDIGNSATNVIGKLGSSMLSQIAQPMADAADGLLKTLSAFWMNINTPNLGAAGLIRTDTSWITALVAVASIMVAAARIAIRRRGEPGTVMLLGLGRLVVVSGAAVVVMTAAGKLADTFSADLMRSTAAHLGSQGWTGKVSTATLAAAIGPGAGLLLIVSVVILVASLIQLMLMVLRVGILVILTGTLPLAAAASMGDWGETWWRKHLGWLGAWLLYKPAAALLYVSAFQLTQQHGSVVEVLSGFALLVLSVLILPALLRVIVPATAGLGAASGGALTMGVAGAVASGAIRVAGIHRTPAPASPAPDGDGGPSGAGHADQAGPPPRSPSTPATRGGESPPADPSSPGEVTDAGMDATDKGSDPSSGSGSGRDSRESPTTNTGDTDSSEPSSGTGPAKPQSNGSSSSAEPESGGREPEPRPDSGPSGAGDPDDPPTRNGG